MKNLLRNMVIFTDEGDVVYNYNFDDCWQFGPDPIMIQEYYTSLFLLAQQESQPQNILNFDDEAIGFLRYGTLYYCIVASNTIKENFLYYLLEKIALLFQNRYGLILPQFNGDSAFFQGFIEYLFQKQVFSIASITHLASSIDYHGENRIKKILKPSLANSK